jgi:hypothetical protein
VKIFTPNRIVATLLLIALFSVACGAIDKLITVSDLGPSAVSRLNIDEATKAKWSGGFRRTGNSLRGYRDADKSTPELKKAAKKQLASDISQIISEDFVKSNNPSAEAWKNDILTLVRAFVGLPPPNAMQGLMKTMPAASAEQDSEGLEVKDSDIKRLESLLKNPPQ